MGDLRVKDVMTTAVVTVEDSSTLHDATITFAINGISGAPVVDDQGNLTGVLSETDILSFVKTLQEEIHRKEPATSFLSVPLEDILKDEKLADVYRDISSKKVRDIMTRDVITVSADTSVMEAIEMMIKKDVNRVPVVEQGKIVGIVTKGDIIWALYRDKFSKA
ncbi:MAG: CBS domain-containing protein [Methanomassiliicoccales archaeon]|nr:CBS domain-containing protein [Methanomassiliicoccales archaeon]